MGQGSGTVLSTENTNATSILISLSYLTKPITFHRVHADLRLFTHMSEWLIKGFSWFKMSSILRKYFIETCKIQSAVSTEYNLFCLK